MIDVGKKNYEEWFAVFDVLNSFNNDYEYMYLNHIITKYFFMAHILFETVIHYKVDNFKHYVLVDINKKTTQLVVASLYSYKIIDVRYKQNNQLERTTKQYKLWIKSVYEKDNFMCQHCGSEKNLNAHHIKPYKDFPKLRTDVNNGILLCRQCHIKEHKRMRLDI